MWEAGCEMSDTLQFVVRPGSIPGASHHDIDKLKCVELLPNTPRLNRAQKLLS